MIMAQKQSQSVGAGHKQHQQQQHYHSQQRDTKAAVLKFRSGSMVVNSSACDTQKSSPCTSSSQSKSTTLKLPTNSKSQQHSHKSTQSDQHVDESQRQQQEQILIQKQQLDGKRILIKNQLYVIEQLQLENANLRNERDQLQLENEELKFQLQMISSSNLLRQPTSSFADQPSGGTPEAMRLPSNATCVGGGSAALGAQQHSQLPQPIEAATMTTANSTTIASLQTTTKTTSASQTAISHNDQIQNQEQQQQLVEAANVLTSIHATPIRQHPNMITNNHRAAIGSVSQPASKSALRAQFATTSVAGKTTSLEPFRAINSVPVNTKLALEAIEDDDLPLREDSSATSGSSQNLVAFGVDTERARSAALVIQRAFRKHQICKRFRTITEQLRQATSNNSTNSNNNNTTCSPNTSRVESKQTHSTADQLTTGGPFLIVSGITRLAAWQSLSQAANRLASSGQNVIKNSVGGLRKAVSSQQVDQLVQENHQNKQQMQQKRSDRKQDEQDPSVFEAAYKFHKLEAIRKRHYRVGLNIFNKNPEKGISFLIAHSFIDSSPPYSKNSSTSMGTYYEQQHHKASNSGNETITSTEKGDCCQQCVEERNLKINVANFLLTRKGLAKEKIGQFLGNLQSQFNQDILVYYLEELNFQSMQVDDALRKFLSTFRLPGEAQKIERIVDCFAQRYVQCQQQHQPAIQDISAINLDKSSKVPAVEEQIVTENNNPSQWLSKDEVFILTFAIIMLNTDLHSPSLKSSSRMSPQQFVNNLRGVFKSPEKFNNQHLRAIYDRVKQAQISTSPDHVTYVMRVQQDLTATSVQKKELANLCAPHRRLLFNLSLNEIHDVNKRERGLHQREVFLFNDLMLVTKITRRARANTPPQYAFRQGVSLRGVRVQLFQSSLYPYGIKLTRKQNEESIIIFNALNEFDRDKFVDNLVESIAEIEEMDAIKSRNIVEMIHFNFVEKLRCHSLMHNKAKVNNPGTSNTRSSENLSSIRSNQVNQLDDSAKLKVHQPAINDQVVDDGASCTSSIPFAQSCDTIRHVGDSTIQVMTPSGLVSAQALFSDEPDDHLDQNQSIASKANLRSSSMLNLSNSTNSDSGSSCGESTSSGSGDGSYDISTKNISRTQIDKSTNGTDLVVRSNPGTKGVTPMFASIGPDAIVVSDRNNNSGPNIQIASNKTSQVQRRCSMSSIHSLDSGFFISRDVSPHQSN